MNRDERYYSHSDFTALMQTALDDPGCDMARLVMRDWLMDQGVDQHQCDEALLEPPTLSMYLPTDYYDIGSGRGRGIGRGSGRGSGRGIGIGIGSGRGIGIGIGSGRRTIMEIGKAYLVITVDWFAWVGRVTRQVGPYEYEFESLSKISETNSGDNWQKLCEGDKTARLAATYQHYKVKGLLGIGAVAKLEWIGKTPQEEGL